MSMTDTNIVTVGQLDTVVDALCDANDARFANIENVYTKTEIDSKMSTVYKPQGSTAFAGLPTPSASNLGYVYNVTDSFTTPSDTFVEGADKVYPAGTNVVVVAEGAAGSETYKFDVLAGFVDLSPYATKAETAVATTAQINEIVSGMYSSGV